MMLAAATRIGLLAVACLSAAACSQQSSGGLPDGFFAGLDTGGGPGSLDGAHTDAPRDVPAGDDVGAGDLGGANDVPVDAPVSQGDTAPPGDAAPPRDATGDAVGGPWQRDYTQHPAVVQRSGVARLWGVSDVHGDRDRLVTLLNGGGLASTSATAPAWTGGTDVLVVSGDSIDKGPQSIEVLDYWLALIPSAKAAGGEVIVLVGNHEVEFLADPTNSKAAALQAELGSETPQMFASTDDPHGRFIHEMPIAAVVDGWFFSHAGNSQGRSLDQIAATFMQLVDNGQWGDPFLVDPNSILEARNWWPASGTRAFLDGYLQALPAKHFVFGHHPTTFANPPSGNIEVSSQGRLLLIDVGMSRAVNYSTGKLLRVDNPGTAGETASMVAPDGTVVALSLQ
jgi:hypothetical protein